MLPSENGGRVENVNESHEIISIRRSITDCATSATIRSWRQIAVTLIIGSMSAMACYRQLTFTLGQTYCWT
jgi:hypothetical protein